jgi:hypothetical protein
MRVFGVRVRLCVAFWIRFKSFFVVIFAEWKKCAPVMILILSHLVTGAELVTAHIDLQ